MALQASLSATFCIFMKGISRPMVPLKIRANACSASTNSSSVPSFQPLSIANSNHHQDHILRPLENFSPDMWGDRFITLPFTNSEFESCSRQVEVLKKLVKDILMNSTADPTENILLINSLCRLGVSYHFETEIEEQLSHLFITLPQLMDNKDYDLRIVADIFQVFRSNGYKMPSDVFNKFKNRDGMFKEELAINIKDMISLYEASHWGMQEELILDEALAFTTLRLESLVLSQRQSCPDHLKGCIANALNRPYHKGMPRLEARQYISFYEKVESRNDILLKFAKYDFNRVQMMHQKELSLLYSWWNKSNIASRFPHVRHRLVESFFIAVAALFEPRFALARNILSKWYIAFALLDDTYDAYGFYEELQHLTKAMERYDMTALSELPGDYLKSLYGTILNISDEIEEEVSKEGRSFGVPYTMAEVKKLVQSYHVVARWTHEHILPTFDEFLKNATWSAALIVSLALLMMGMEEADEDAYQWLINCDAKILTASSVLCRLYNDIQSNEEEEKRGQFSMLACYMKEYGVSKKEAIEGCRERIRIALKDLNEGFMVRPTPVPRQILLAAFNLPRVVDVLYKDGDGFTKPGISHKHYITKVLIDPISLQE